MNTPTEKPNTYATKGDVAKSARKRKALSVEAAAEQWGISQSTIKAIENGKGASIYTIEQFATSCGIPKEELLTDDSKVRLGYVPSPAGTTLAPTPLSGEAGEPSLPKDHVSLAELGLFLDHYARLTGLSTSVIAENFVFWEGVGEQWPDRALGGKEDVEEYFQSELFKGRVQEDEPFHRLQRLLAAFNDPYDSYDVPTLMAEWMCARRRADTGVLLKYGEFSSPPCNAAGDRNLFGVKATYRNAPDRLSGMECAFVRFELQANVSPPPSKYGSRPTIDRMTELLKNIHDEDAVKSIPHSKLHVHPGDEIIYVTEGVVYVELANTGLWVPVMAGDYMHFNAEIPHAVWNVYDTKASALIIRFFQLKRHGTRHRQLEKLSQIEQLMRELGAKLSPNSNTQQGLLDRLSTDLADWIRHTKLSYKLWSELTPWIHDRTRRPQDRLQEVTEHSRVQDLVGISTFLLTCIADLPDPEILDLPKVGDLRDAIRALGTQAHDQHQTTLGHSFQLLTDFTASDKTGTATRRRDAGCGSTRPPRPGW